MTDRLKLLSRSVPTGAHLARLVGLALALAWAGAARAQNTVTSYVWATIAGSASSTSLARVDGPGTFARFYWPFGIAVDGAGNIFVGDSYNNSIRKISASGVVSTLAGSTIAGFADGASSAARFNNPEGVAVDSAGNVYVADTLNGVIRKITASGVVSTIAGTPGVVGFGDGTGGAARFNFPRGIAVDSTGNLFVADSLNHIVRKIDATGTVTTFAGAPTVSGSNDGADGAARFNQPWGVAVDAAGNIFVSDYSNATIRRITRAGVVATIAGSAGLSGSADGTGTAARFFQPGALAVDAAGNVFVADTFNQTIRKITATGVVTTIGGKAGVRGAADGLTGTATFSAPYGIAVDAAGVVYVADQDNSTIRSGTPPGAPVITVPPQSVTVTAGVGASFSVVASSATSVTYQWLFNGTAIAGATTSSYSIASAQARDAGLYSVVVTSSVGSATSAAATLTVSAAPSIATAPASTTIGASGTAVLSVAAVGSGNLTYQWLRDGAPVTGATNATLTTSVAGSYSVVVGNSFGSVTSASVRVEFPNRLVNLSTRGIVGTGGNALVAGLVVQAPAGATKSLLIRGVGPALAAFGVESPVAQTSVTVNDNTGRALASNQGWLNSANARQLVDTAVAVGAFALPTPSTPSAPVGDSAVLVNLATGIYTVTVAGVGNATGNGLIEIYEVGADNTRLVNLSTRGAVTAANGLTAGIVVQGTSATKVLVRAVGPALAQFGVTGALARPQLVMFSGSTQLATNTGWSTAANSTQVSDAATAAGAFPFPAGSNDCALLMTLNPGNYTAQVSGASGSTGTALIEVYQVP